MSKNLGYARKFIILRKDYSTMADLNPKGHGKLEVKGLRAFISLNLENAEANNYYDVVLVGTRNNYNLGKIYVEENQKGYGEFFFGIKNLEQMGFSLEMINGILILNNDDVLLGGYFNKADNSIENYLDLLEARRERAVLEVFEEEFIEEVEETEEVVDQEHIDIVEGIAKYYSEIEVIISDPLIEDEIEDRLDEIVAKYSETEEELIFEETKAVEEEIVEIVESPQELEFEEVVEELEVIDSIQEPEVIDSIQEPEVIDSIEEFSNDEPLIWEELFEPIDQNLEEAIVEPSIEEIFISALEDLFQAKENDTMVTNQDEPIEPVVEEIDYDQFQNKNKIIQRNQTTGYIMKILRYFPYTEPFKVNLKGYNWWKINTDDPNEENGFLPYFSYVTGGNHKYPIIENAITANELMRKHKHYIFGLYNFKDEVKFYVYGIPGKFVGENHPQKGLTGFNTWYEDKNNEGYWLLYIDPLTGRVIYPINPMIPID